ncbi:MAG: nucleotidyltransferase domain-containing protein [Bacteroidota bacterium]
MSAVSVPIRAEILDRLRAIEAEEDVRIVYACESGSRAWGFPSADSDYDVRFLYVRPPDWYLSIDVERRRDVIERPISMADSGAVLDLSGWDLRKALGLLRKSNGPLLEWLGSPIAYYEVTPCVSALRGLAAAAFQPRAAYHHYRSMAQRTYETHLCGDSVRAKKYFYALRPLLAVRWIEASLGPVPTAFGTLLDAVAPSDAFRATVTALIEAKRTGSEADARQPITALQAFVENELDRLNRDRPDLPTASFPLVQLNAFFRETVEAAWAE